MRLVDVFGRSSGLSLWSLFGVLPTKQFFHILKRKPRPHLTTKPAAMTKDRDISLNYTHTKTGLPMMSRRELLKIPGAAAVAAVLPAIDPLTTATPKDAFRFCLNTSTISGQKPGLKGMIEIAGAAGYDGMELWINDIRDYLKQGNSVQSLASLLSSKGLVAE